MKTLKNEESLLLMIDIQPSLFSVVCDNRELETNCKLLLQLQSVLRLPLIVTTQNAQKLGDTIESLAKRFPQEQKIFDKMTFDALAAEAVDEAVRSLRRNTLVLFGIEAHICVFQTAIHCLHQGYSIVLVSDAVSSRTLSNKKAGVKAIRQAGGRIMSTEMVVYGLLEKAGTPEFKSMLPFLKDSKSLK